MGIVLTSSDRIYEILESLCGSDSSKVPQLIESLSNEDLVQLSEEIASFHKQNFHAVLEDLRNNTKEFNSYPLSYHQYGGLDLLRQLSLYSNKIVMRDPIYDALFNPAYVQPNIRAVKDGLKSSIPAILELEPLVRIGIIQYVPYPALQPTLLKLAENQIEEDLRNKEWKKEIAQTIAYKLYPEKNILLMSLGNPPYSSYRLFRYGRIVGTEKETNDSLFVKMISPDSLLGGPLGITQEDINGWIISEINNEVFRTTKTVNENIVLSEAMNTSIVTDNEVYEKMLGLKNIAFTGKSLSNLFPSILKISVPFVDNLPFNKLVELREKEKNTFLDFQIFLKNLASNIDYSKPSEIRRQIQQITKEELEPILQKLTREYQRIKNSALIRGVPRAAIAIGTVITSLAIGEPIIAALGSIVSWKLFKDVTDEYAAYLEKEANLKDNSLYFLWKASKIPDYAKKTPPTSNEGFPDKIEVDGKEFAEKMEGLGIRLYPNVLGDQKSKEDKSNKKPSK
jgi:hypothetical protein